VLSRLATTSEKSIASHFVERSQVASVCIRTGTEAHERLIRGALGMPGFRDTFDRSSAFLANAASDELGAVLPDGDLTVSAYDSCIAETLILKARLRVRAKDAGRPGHTDASLEGAVLTDFYFGQATYTNVTLAAVASTRSAVASGDGASTVVHDRAGMISVGVFRTIFGDEHSNVARDLATMKHRGTLALVHARAGIPQESKAREHFFAVPRGFEAGDRRLRQPTHQVWAKKTNGRQNVYSEACADACAQRVVIGNGLGGSVELARSFG
jgi:hypothetical protein